MFVDVQFSCHGAYQLHPVIVGPRPAGGLEFQIGGLADLMEFGHGNLMRAV